MPLIWTVGSASAVTVDGVPSGGLTSARAGATTTRLLTMTAAAAARTVAMIRVCCPLTPVRMRTMTPPVIPRSRIPIR
jgi:hypothetical protein